MNPNRTPMCHGLVIPVPAARCNMEPASNESKFTSNRFSFDSQNQMAGNTANPELGITADNFMDDAIRIASLDL